MQCRRFGCLALLQFPSCKKWFPHKTGRDCIYLQSGFILHITHPRLETKGQRWAKNRFKVELFNFHTKQTPLPFLVLISVEWVGYELGIMSGADMKSNRSKWLTSVPNVSTTAKMWVRYVWNKVSFEKRVNIIINQRRLQKNKRIDDSYLKNSKSKKEQGWQIYTTSITRNNK